MSRRFVFSSLAVFGAILAWLLCKGGESMVEMDSGAASQDPTTGREYFRRHVAEQIKFALGASMPANWEVAVKKGDFGNKIAASFAMFLLGREIRRDIEKYESVPVTWWDHSKVRFSFLRRVFGPPTLRTIETEVKHWHVCPHIATPDHHRHHEFLVSDRPSP